MNLMLPCNFPTVMFQPLTAFILVIIAMHNVREQKCRIGGECHWAFRVYGFGMSRAGCTMLLSTRATKGGRGGAVCRADLQI